MALTIIGDILSPRERGRYQGYMGSVFAFSSVVGPLLGGLFVDHLSWRWVFYINLPIGIAALVVTSFGLNLPFVRRPHRIDYEGAALLVAGVSCLLLVTVWGGTEYPWGSPTIVDPGRGRGGPPRACSWCESTSPPSPSSPCASSATGSSPSPGAPPSSWACR